MNWGPPGFDCVHYSPQPTFLSTILLQHSTRMSVGPSVSPVVGHTIYLLLTRDRVSLPGL